jgi:hypothetical protein
MIDKHQRRADLALVSAYFEARVADLLQHVADAIVAYRSGELDALEVDDIIHRYSRSARELWKFCWSPRSGPALRTVASVLESQASEGQEIDRWERGAPRERR